MSKEEFKLDDYTKGMGKDLTSDDSLVHDYPFTDTIAFDQENEGVPGGNLLWYGAQIKKKRFSDDAVEGIWMGVDSDGLAKISIGSTTTGQLVWNGGNLFIAGYFILGSSGVPTDEHIAIGADFIRLFNTANEQVLELAPGTVNGGTITFWDAAGDVSGVIFGYADGADDTLRIEGVDGIIFDTPVAVFLNGIAVNADTASPAGGANQVLLSSTPIAIATGSGVPTLSSPKGSLYLRTDGSGINDRAYINTDGSTTWTAIVTLA